MRFLTDRLNLSSFNEVRLANEKWLSMMIPAIGIVRNHEFIIHICNLLLGKLNSFFFFFWRFSHVKRFNKDAMRKRRITFSSNNLVILLDDLHVESPVHTITYASFPRHGNDGPVVAFRWVALIPIAMKMVSIRSTPIGYS